MPGFLLIAPTTTYHSLSGQTLGFDPDRFIDSVCDGFTNALNARGGSYCNQDGYEIMSAAFGSRFDEARLRAATDADCQAMADELASFGERVDAVATRRLLAAALRQWSGSDEQDLAAARGRGAGTAMSVAQPPGTSTDDRSTDAGLARYFRYHVGQGGFAQLLFNLQGEYLAEIGDLLDRAGASVALRHYEQAIHACLDDESAYQAFLAGDFVSESPLKSALQRLSIAYFATKVPFDEEAAPWLASIAIDDGPGRGVVVGLRAAHSGASTTVAYPCEVRAEWRIEASDVLESRLPAVKPMRAPTGPLQASLHREGRGAGRLGARFTPAPETEELIVRVAVGLSESPLVYGPVGLSQAEARAVLDELASQDGSAAFRAFGPGRLEVLWATSHPIDGSTSGMQRLAALLVPLLTLPVEASEDDVTTAWRNHAESVRVSRAMKWLRAMLAEHPERGAFRAGAAPEAVDRLETSLGLTLPAAVRFMLERTDGGSFADDSPPADRNTPYTCCHLLSAEEIGTASSALIAVNEATKTVERLRSGEGLSTAWPYLPIAGTSEGGVLVVELTGRGRVLDAFDEVRPSAWGVVCERYVDFVENFLYDGGCVKLIGRTSNDEDDGSTASRAPVESVRLSRAMKDLRTLLSEHPERGAFRAGAAPEAVDRLEASLGVALPAAVRFLLERTDGGSFADDRAPLDEDRDDAGGTRCDLLSVDEIEAATFDLIAINDPSTEVERWEGKRAIRPRLKRPDGSLVPWPYLAIARTCEGGDLLVLDLAAGGRILDAWHEVGPSQWGVVFERYIDFVEKFLADGGRIQLFGRSSNGDGRATGVSP